MTYERKEEVNRRLMLFDGRSEELSAHIPDYTTDLNALARLERKLPHHDWKLLHLSEPYARAAIFQRRYPNHGGQEDWHGTGASEAEARAEAICQYLESCQ